jgi:anti-anti-sigma factor
VSLLEISVEAGDPGPVVVLAGEADHSSITQLNEVLTAQVSARTSHLIIDVTNLRSADPATAQALMLAALIVRVQGGNPVLLNPQPLVAQVLDHLRAAETFTIVGRASAENQTGYQRRLWLSEEARVK